MSATVLGPGSHLPADHPDRGRTRWAFALRFAYRLAVTTGEKHRVYWIKTSEGWIPVVTRSANQPPSQRQIGF